MTEQRLTTYMFTASKGCDSGFGTLSSHLNVLEASAALYPSLSAFKIPQLSGDEIQWKSISYKQLRADVESAARYWAMVLAHDEIPQRSVIGLWVNGLNYADVLHIYGISRAGYIPQLFSLRLPNPDGIYELLRRGNARALIYDPVLGSDLNACPVPSYAAISPIDTSNKDTLPEMPPVNEQDISFIFHTSGSTSGSPKLVPCNYRWLNSAVQKSNQVSRPRDTGRQDVTVWMGSMCHIGQAFMLIGCLQHGSCIIQPSAIAFTSQELVHMVHSCGLNRLNQFAPFLAIHLRNSRDDPKLLSILSALDEVLYSGLPLPRDEEEWAYNNGIKLRNLFGSTECGAMLLSIGGGKRDAPLLQPLEGVSYEFRPVSSSQVKSTHRSTARLLELVILATSRDCPDLSLRHPDGDFHTGDLFQEGPSGSFVFRGRDDDWIKTENGLRCDTKAIEDNVKTTCGNLVAECVVVGFGRPSPAMFIEPNDDMDHTKLKKEIIRRTRHFHSRRYLHERITSTDLIIVVPPQSLPRTTTKGNIRRKAVEETFEDRLDHIYGRSR